MGDKDNRQHDGASDAHELGYVENVHDLEPDGQVGASRKATEQQRLLNPNAAGYFEIEAGTVGGLGAPLHLGPELKKDGGTKIGQYEAGYNAYSLPLRSTLRAMGRIKDVSMTGAPMAPADLMKDPKLAARFRRLSLSSGDVQQDQAFDTWSTNQTKMNIDVQRFGAGQHELVAAVSDYRRVQMLLSERRTEAKKSAKTAELHDIEETAETLARIVEVSVEAWDAMNTIEEAIDSKVAFDENAEGPESNEVSKGTKPDWEHATADDPSGVILPGTKSKQQKRADVAGGLVESGGMAAKIAANAKAQLLKTGKFELGLKDVMILAIDGSRYAALQKDIVKLEAQIKKLQLDQEGELVKSATSRLVGFKMEFVARRLDVQADRVAARKGARTFAKSMGAGTEGIMAMYAAEAYQELAAFGELAAEQRKSMVDPLWGPVHGYLHGYDKHRFVAIGAAEDAAALSTNLRAVHDQRSYFKKELPHWQHMAKQWSDFLGTRTNSPLISEGNDADDKSRAP